MHICVSMNTSKEMEAKPLCFIYYFTVHVFLYIIAIMRNGTFWMFYIFLCLSFL